MASSPPELPFAPPVDGCEIEHVHHVGPFITRVDFRLPDGQTWAWTSRRHRYAGSPDPLIPGPDAVDARITWWEEVALYTRLTWWVAALFMIGASCFALASSAGLAPRWFGDFAASPLQVNLVFFTGSLFFTAAAYLQLLGAVNADRISAIANRRTPTERFRWFALRPGEIGWASAFTQFVGTVLFNFNTFDALIPGLDWLQEDLVIWGPDVFGSVCFLVASGLAVLEYSHARPTNLAHDVSWWIVTINMLGSVAFGVAAFYAIFLPGTGDMLDAGAVNAWTLLGAICFLVGAYLLLPELRRNIKHVVKAVH